MTRLETALRDANAQRGLSRSSSRRTSKEPATARQMSRTSSTRRRSMASPSNSLRQSREGFDSNLAAERSVLPAGLSWLTSIIAQLHSPLRCFACVKFCRSVCTIATIKFVCCVAAGRAGDLNKVVGHVTSSCLSGLLCCRRSAAT